MSEQAAARRGAGGWSPARKALAGVLGAAALVLAVLEPLYAWQPALACVLAALSLRAIVRVLAAATFLLLILGGSVTTYRVGMAVPDWPTTFQENMFLFPLERMWEEGWAVTLEHGHRLLASAVGLVTLCLVAYGRFHERGRALRAASWMALVAVVLQGVLGGTRVLEDSQHLAFLHGAFAQVFYALVAALLVLSSRAWSAPAPQSEAGGLARTARLATALVFVQIVLGAWLRHSGAQAAVMAHVVFALAAVAGVLALARRLEEARSAPAAGPLAGVRRWLLGSLAAQLALGVLALIAILNFSGGFDGAVSVGEAVAATLHVAVGALLLGACVAACLWGGRVERAAGQPAARQRGAEATA